jgi:muramoyltetrapeptide carboxypeptidase LdcA involved in peptidoglycan recycling
MGGMRPDFTPPPKLSRGDRVAVLSLSFAAPAIFPAVHEQAMRRLRAQFGLEPVEYPTTRRLNADPRDRAADLMAASRWIRPPEDYAGCILLLETSEERPAAEEVFRMLRNFGERGLLAQFPAVIVARAKAATFGVPADLTERQRYRDDQREAVLRALEYYHPAAMAVFNVDFGHTDPQYVLPYGGSLTVDGPARRITAHY